MNKERGFIALTSVLIIMAVIMVLGITAFHSSLIDQAISASFDNSLEASTLAHACAQEGLSILKNEINYSQGYGAPEENQQEVYPQEGYDPGAVGDSNLIIELAEQVFSEKMQKL